ncbi:MAG: histidine phosphatase family protein [Anaerolineaceae bacterium]|nr:histidine phosphatase family protein [Anaerolineaceae bacterium]
MAIILLIRHGENDWVGKKLAGRLPGVHLNQNGLNQAKVLATTLQNLPIKAIYSSPLDRALETAQPLAQVKKMEISICENLSEINFGDWQGKTIKQMRRLKLWETVQKHPSQMQFPNGESFIGAQHRLVDCITQISEKHEPFDLVACFSHSDAIRLLVAYYLNVPLDTFQRIHINTASISTLMLTNEHISVPFINLIDVNKFASQYTEVEKKPSKKISKDK